MFTLLAILGTLAVGYGVYDFFTDEDEATETGETDETAVVGLSLIGLEDIDEMLEGGDGDDTITGNEYDADTLIGGAGDDVYYIDQGNTAVGGEGDDTFHVLAHNTAPTISDFDPDEDTLVLENIYDYRGPVSAHLVLMKPLTVLRWSGVTPPCLLSRCPG